jgi:predicted dehydrogenase
VTVGTGTDRPLRLLQVGVGGWGFTWAGVPAQVPGVEAVGYVDVSAGALAKAAEKYGMAAERCFTDIGQALESVEADAALIVVPPEYHMPAALPCLEAGLHVLVEKPFADTVANARRMAALAGERGLTLMVNQNYRYRLNIQTARAALDSGELGPLSYVLVNFHKAPPFEGSFRLTMDDPMLIELSIHHFDMMRFVTRSNARAIYARSWNAPWTWFRGDANAAAVIEMENGVVLDYFSCWNTRGYQTSWDGEWQLECRDGGLLWTDRVYRTSAGERTPIDPVDLPISERAASLNEFASALREAREPETGATDNMHSLALLHAALLSVREKRRVELAEILDA